MKKSLYLRLAAFSAAAAAGSSAFAVTDPISTMLATVDLTTVSVTIAAICVLVVGIALTFKSPDIAKRVIRKV